MTNARSLVSVLLLAACGPGGVATVGEPDGSPGGSSSGSTGGGVTTGVAPTTTDGAQTTTNASSTGGSSGESTEALSASTGVASSEGGETTGSTGASETTSGETTTSEDETSMSTLPGETSAGSTGEDVCAEDAVACVGANVKVCDGMGGFKQTFDCSVAFNDGAECVQGVGCVSACDKAFEPPACSSGYPRVMLIMDASSSMLNLQGGAVRAKEGQGGWEQMRESIAGNDPLFDVLVPGGTFEELSYFGMLVFGHNAPDETELIAQYGACRHDLLQWALDPATSCVAPGCTDQYADAPISWTTRDGAWAFGESVQSHMPTCNKGTMPNKGCFGSGTYVHLGLQRAQQNLAAYKAACANDPDAPCDGDTQFINIVVLDGTPNSSEAEYAAPLQAMFDQGVVTHVIGFGDGVDGPNAITAMNKMASYGSGGALMYRDANNQSAFEGHLASIVQGLDYGGC